ncbi:MAG: PqqD family protein [Prevotellaceae bacterium]|nr:PqqD family protein [Prevotellaceae bacterium]
MNSQIYGINSNISWKVLKDNVVAVNLDNGNYYTFNFTASLIWQYLDQNKTIAEIEQLINTQFPDTETVEKDVEEIISYWLPEKLISKK